MISKIELPHLFISAGHNYIGHHGRPAGSHPMQDVPQLHCVAGRGVRGDRFFDHEENYKGQITFFAWEIYEQLCAKLGVWDKHVSVFRRNVITRGLDLNSLAGHEFELQGVKFFGVETCRPCYWMNQAFHPEAEEALQGRGGLRARIVESGILTASTLREHLMKERSPVTELV